MEEKTWLPRYKMILTVFYELNLNIPRRKCPEVETDQMRRISTHDAVLVFSFRKSAPGTKATGAN